MRALLAESERRKFAWERSYPAGLRWDAPVATSTLPALLDAAVVAFGARPAIEFRGRRIEFRELGALADRAAAGLLRLGVRPGERVALLLPNTPWHPVFFFGALRAGACVVHLSPLDPPRALARKLADSGARILVTTDRGDLLDAALRLLVGEHVARVVVGEETRWSEDVDAAIPDDPRIVGFDEFGDEIPTAWPAREEGDVALLQYTGGTTGAPRAAMLTHANLTAAVSMLNAWNIGLGREPRADDRVICALPLFHIFALTTVLLRSLSNGVEILLRPRFDISSVLQDIEFGRATFFPGVPTMWIALANTPGIERHDFSSLRHVSSGGAPLPREIAERLAQLTGRRLGGGWGMTETSPVGTNMLPGMAMRDGLIGVPLPGVEMDVAALDDPRRVLPPGETGEIRIRGPNVTAGYWNREAETRAAFAGGFFLTGDVGYMDPDGVFFLVDRKKDMIISGGFNVYPRIIEEAIYEHPDIAEAAVIGIADAYRGQAAKAFVCLREGAPELTLTALRAFLAERIGRHELPAALEIRDALPRTQVGKLSRQALVDEAEGKIGWI